MMRYNDAYLLVSSYRMRYNDAHLLVSSHKHSIISDVKNKFLEKKVLLHHLEFQR